MTELTPQPIASYAVNISLSPQMHPDGKLRNHIILHYSSPTTNIAMDLGPSDAVAKLAEQLAPALTDAVDKARRADLGLIEAPANTPVNGFQKKGPR